VGKPAWPINPILTIPSTGATARNKCALSPMRSAIKGLGTQSYGSWQTTNFLLLGRKNEPTFWVPKTQVRQGADRDKRGRTHGPRAEIQRGNREETRTGKSFGEAREVAKRNCAHAGCECHDLAPVAQGAAWGSACTQGGSARPDAQRGPDCSTPARKFTVAATDDRSASS
jgi:hypothetical protein